MRIIPAGDAGHIFAAQDRIILLLDQCRWYIFVDMIGRVAGNRGVAVFVLVFLCLNAVGALCLTWCLERPAAAHAAMAADDAHMSEHCRMMRQQAEHAKQADDDRSRIETGQAACCMMPVAMFAAPIEKRIELAKVIAVAVTPAIEVAFAAPIVSYQRSHATPVYRPPPQDRSGSRQLNCVIRI